MTHVAGVAPDSYRDSGYPSRILAWTTVILLLSAYAVSLVDRQILSLLIEPVRRHFEITDTQISLLAGIAFVIFYTLLVALAQNLIEDAKGSDLVTRTPEPK